MIYHISFYFFISPEHYSSESYSSPGTSQPHYQEHTSFDNPSQFEPPATAATPTNMRITRNTRARLRGMIEMILIYVILV